MEGLVMAVYIPRLVRDPQMPALLPQVYLHYDPYVRRDPAERPGSVIRQRMDFLLLLAHRRRGSSKLMAAITTRPTTVEQTHRRTRPWWRRTAAYGSPTMRCTDSAAPSWCMKNLPD